MNKVAFLGLGVMGFQMAGHLVEHNYDVVVYNRTRSKAIRWLKQHKGSMAATPAAAVAEADIVFCCVGNDDHLRSISLGEGGAFNAMAAGAVFVDHSTVSMRVSRELSSIADNLGFSFIDAPVSGGEIGAQKGVLSVMCGGNYESYSRVKPAIACYADMIALMGAVGNGQLTKMVNQICIAGLLQGLSEGLDFAEKAGLDAKAVIDIIASGTAGSWQMNNRGYTMVEDKFDFGFTVDLMRKDLKICLVEAANNGVILAVTQLVDSYYADIQSMGGWTVGYIKSDSAFALKI